METILSIAGKPGLYKLVSRGNRTLIVETLDETHKRVPAFATALGNKLVSIPGHMWDMPLPVVWGTLMVICLLAALFIFSIIKKLNRVS